MQVEQLNDILRITINNLIDDGYKKSSICGVTLGTQSTPHFQRFINGYDLGVKPLSRIVDGFGYDLQLVCVPKKDKNEINEVSNNIYKLNENFIQSAQTALKNYLNGDNKQTISKTKTIEKESVRDFLDSFLSGLDE